MPTCELLCNWLELFWADVQIVVGIQGGEEKEAFIPQRLQGHLLKGKQVKVNGKSATF